MTVWADSNVLIRFLTGQPSQLASRARRILRRAADGELVLRISTIVIAEVIWVLQSVYRAEPAAIRDAVSALALAQGIVVDDEQIVLDSVRSMVEANVSYTDAFIATSARSRGEPVATFDSDFRRLGVERVN